MKTPEEMRQLEDLFHRAVSLETDQRASFIDKLRSSNPDLGADVESLVAAYEKKTSFIESPVYEATTDLIEGSRSQLTEGWSIGRYRIIAPLGRGGMGEVYLARDSSLARQVALKLLPSTFTADQSRLRRFVQEARTASALNHPNILTIHEIGQADNVHFIATEFVKGHTLRHRLSQKAMELTDALDVAIQVASALEAAHEAGIIHRDIKPENIMLRPDGYVKVLDFGLAKLTEPLRESRPSPVDSETTLSHYTEPGTVMGTVNYMSPEQARGLTVDPRTDIFSLGVVMYEMVSGRRPFVGETGPDTILSILTHEPPPLTDSLPEIPGAFEAIVSKALQKVLNQRYQTVGELLLELKNLKQEFVFQKRFGRLEPESIRVTRDTAASTPAAAELKTQETALLARPAGNVNRPRPGLTLALVAAVSSAVITGSIIWYRTTPAGPRPSPAAVESRRSLTYSITVQKYRDGKPYAQPFRLRDDINFEKDYRIRLNVSSPQNGYLYLLNEEVAPIGKAPSFVVLFPSETANNGSAQLKANQEIQIPQQTWFGFDEHQGAEKIWIVWAERSLDPLEAIKRFANPTDKGKVNDTQLSANVDGFLKSHRFINPSVERDQDKLTTAVRANGDVLVYPITLSHY